MRLSSCVEGDLLFSGGVLVQVYKFWESNVFESLVKGHTSLKWVFAWMPNVPSRAHLRARIIQVTYFERVFRELFVTTGCLSPSSSHGSRLHF